MASETTRYAVEIPYLGSLILTHDWNGRIPGLKEFAPEDRPNSTIVFWSFRVMVGLGMLMLLLGVWSLWLRSRQRLFRSKLFLRFAIMMGPSGLIAILTGWYTTEIGRQPWVVYGVMRTKDAVSNHSALALSTTLIVILVMYFAVFGTGVSYMLKLVAKGPEEPGSKDARDESDAQNRRPARPLSAVPDLFDPGVGETPTGKE
jgi:cytochrome d ubiquinol oxidase subunit I